MMTVQSLSQSVNHWQFIYIASITLALLATFAIVAFAFHWDQNKEALRFSNYIYVLFSLVAVIATIVIVIKTNSLDAEKDRQVKIATDANDLKIAQAQANAVKARSDAATATGNAATAQAKAEQARQKAESIHAKAEEARTNSLEAEKQANEAVIDKEKILHDNLLLQKQVEDERQARLRIEETLAPRDLGREAQENLVNNLRYLPPMDIDIVINSGDTEAQRLAGQFAYPFQKLGWTVSFYTPMGGGFKSVSVQFDPTNKQAVAVAEEMSAMLNTEKFAFQVIPNATPVNSQLGAYTSGNNAKGNAAVKIFVGQK